MWTYTITNSQLSDGRVQVTVTFINGNDSVTRNFFPLTVDDVKKSIKSQIAELEKNELLLAEIQSGITDLNVPDPTPAETAEQTFFQNYAKWRILDNAVRNGLLPNTDPTYTDLYALVKSTYKIEYQVM